MGAYVTALNDPDPERYQSYRYAADKPQEVEPAPPGHPASKTFEYRAPCDQPKGNIESDLCAQWKAANAAQDSALWTKWGVWVGIVGSSLLLWQIILTRRAVEDTGEATEAMREANQIAGKSSRDQQRAYVGVESAQIVINGWSIKLVAKIKNYGLTPARNVSLEMGLQLVVGGFRATDKTHPSDKVDGPAMKNNLGEMLPGGFNKTDWIGWTNAVIGLPNLYKEIRSIKDIHFLPVTTGNLTWTTVFGEEESLSVSITFEDFVEDNPSGNRRFTGTGIIYHSPQQSTANDDSRHHEG